MKYQLLMRACYTFASILPLSSAGVSITSSAGISIKPKKSNSSLGRIILAKVNGVIHFGNLGIRILFDIILIIFICAVFENTRVIDFCSVSLTRLVSYFLWKIHVSNRKNACIDVVIDCFFALRYFRVILKDRVYRLSVFNQRTNDIVQRFDFFFSSIYTGSVFYKNSPVFFLGSCGTIIVLIKTATTFG